MDARKQLQKEQWLTMLEKTETMVSQIPVLGNDGIPVLHRDPMQLETATASLRRDAMEEETGNLFQGIDSIAGDVNSQQPSGKKKDFLRGRADRLLGQYNFDADKLERELHQIVPRVSQQTHEEVVHDHHLQVISSTIHEALLASVAETDHQALNLMEEEWESEKQQLLNELRRSDTKALGNGDQEVMHMLTDGPQSGTVPIGDTPFNYDPVSSHHFETGSAVKGDDADRVTMYMKTLRNHGNGSPERLLSELFMCTSSFPSNLPSCKEAWKLTESIHTNTFGASSEDPIAWFKGARMFLENQHLRLRVNAKDNGGNISKSVCEWLTHLATSEPVLGGSQLSSLLKHYSPELNTSMRSNNGGILGGVLSQEHQTIEPIHYYEGDVTTPLPLWAVVYYCLRSGGWADAVRVLKDQNQPSAMVTHVCEVLGHIVRQMNEPKTNVDDSELSDALKKLANTAAHESILTSHDGHGSYGGSDDQSRRSMHIMSPWQKAILFLLLKKSNAQLFERSVNTIVQDYMWMKLCLITVQPMNRKDEQMNLAAGLQNTLIRSGPEHFSDSNDPQLFARVLLMAKLPLQALEYLANCKCPGTNATCIADAVHIAICLRNVLNQEEITGISSILCHYSRRLNPSDALLYLNLFVSPEDETRTPPAIVDGLVSTLIEADRADEREFDALFQSINSNLRGAVLCKAGDRIYNGKEQETFRALRLLSRSEAGIQDALRIAIKGLVKTIRPPHHDREKWIEFVEKFPSKRYAIDRTSSTDHIPLDLSKPYLDLRDLLFFTQDISNGLWDSALAKSRLLLPASPAEVNVKLKNYYHLDENVLEVFPTISEQAIKALEKAKNNSRDNPKLQYDWQQRFSAFEIFFAKLQFESQNLSKLLTKFKA